MSDLTDRLDHAFLPYVADPSKRALLVELAAGIAHTHAAAVLTGHEAGIPSPTATTPEEAA